MSADGKPCEHESFTSHAVVTRLTETGDLADTTVTGYTLDLRVTCDGCGEPFVFLGLAPGMSFTHPMVSADGTELRAPIQPRAWGDPMTPISPAPAEA